MSNYPFVAILVITYQRADILRQTLRGLVDHLAYEGEVVYVVADDSSTDHTAEVVIDHRIESQARVLMVTTDRGGLGANANNGLRAAFGMAEYVLQLQDDMELLTTLDLTPHVDWLMHHEQDGFIRLWGVGGHRYTATLDERYWRIDWSCDELYIPSDRPHLKHKRFHDAAGWYPEGLKSAETEDHWSHQCKNIAKATGLPFVLVPHGLDTEKNFSHNAWGSRWRDQGL